MGCDGECEIGYDLSLSFNSTSVREERKGGIPGWLPDIVQYFTCSLHCTALQDETLHQAQIFTYMKNNTACMHSHNVRGTKILDLGVCGRILTRMQRKEVFPCAGLWSPRDRDQDRESESLMLYRGYARGAGPCLLYINK